MRNGHLGVLLKTSLFPDVSGAADPIGKSVFYVVAFYGIMSMVITGFEVIASRFRMGVIYRRRRDRGADEPTAP